MCISAKQLASPCFSTSESERRIFGTTWDVVRQRGGKIHSRKKNCVGGHIDTTVEGFSAICSTVLLQIVRYKCSDKGWGVYTDKCLIWTNDTKNAQLSHWWCGFMTWIETAKSRKHFPSECSSLLNAVIIATKTAASDNKSKFIWMLLTRQREILT